MLRSELGANDLPKRLVLKALNNQINISLINPNILCHVFPLDISEYPTYQHQYYHD